MKTRALIVALALSVIAPHTAAAWDPDRGDDRDAPIPTAPPSDPAPYLAPPPDLYYVTDTYVADVVTTTGPLTTYSTTTVRESTGSYARVLDSVGTGASSAFDGAAFNGRAALTDGRSVAGTYYENYILTADGFVPVSVVFFQDDAELARMLAATPAPAASAPRALSAIPSATLWANGRCCAPPPTLAASVAPVATPLPIAPRISVLPDGASLARVEVLRGRRITLWLRATIDGRDASVRSWRLVSGDPGDARATTGAGSTPFESSWDRLAPAGAAYELRFRLVVGTVPGERMVDASVSIVIRSPALAY